MALISRDYLTATVAGALLTCAGFLWLLPKSFAHTSYDEVFVHEVPILTMNQQGYIAQLVVLVAMLVLAIGARTDRSRFELSMSRVLLIVFGLWPVAIGIVSAWNSEILSMTYITLKPLDMTHIFLAVAAGIMAIRIRLLGTRMRWAVPALAVSYVMMMPLAIVAMVQPELTSSSLFLTLYIQLIPYCHFIVGILLLIAGVTSWVRTAKSDTETHSSEATVSDR